MNILHKFFVINPRASLKEMYIFSVLFSFASALILIFEPVFFYQEGFGLSKIALYYALHYSLYVILLPLGGKFAGRFGLERSLSLAMPIFVVYFLTLAAIPLQSDLFWVAWILLTVFKIFYWPAYHTEICRFGNVDNQGTELSWLIALTSGVGAIGPIIGGFVAAYFGFSVLFILAASLALWATFPLLRTKERYRPQKFPYFLPWRMMSMRRHRRMVLTMVGWGENLIDLVFWPIFMFIILGGTQKLGLIASINVLVISILGFFIGEISDRFSRRQIIKLHIPFMVLGYLFRPLASTSLRIFLTDTLSKTALIGVRIPMWHVLYQQGRREGALRYAVTFEMVLAVSKAVVAFALVGVFAVSLPYTGFTVAWVMAAGLALLYVCL